MTNEDADPKATPVLHGVDSQACILPEAPDIQESEATSLALTVDLSRRRFVVLILFILYSMSNAFQWIQFSIISNIVEDYYQVSAKFVEWTSMIYMILYIPLIFPASWYLEHKGLRHAVLLGCFGTAVGSWLKCFAVDAGTSWLLMTGQSLVAASQTLLLGIPPHLAARWFGAQEISTACSVGVFGNQLGIALGFVLPPVLVPLPDGSNNDDVKFGFRLMFLCVSSIVTLVFITIFFVFQERPSLPPSHAEALARLRTSTKEPSSTTMQYIASINRLARNPNYIILLLSYGINVGVFYAISTLLNPIFLLHFEGKEQDAGRIGLAIVVAGMLGSVVCGFFLDRTHRFKLTTIFAYGLSLLGMVAFTFILPLGQLWAVYCVAAALGFSMTGYLAIGFEFASELTYPEGEGTTSGLLNASAQVFGLLLTNLASYLKDVFDSSQPPNLLLSAVLVLGLVLTFFIKPDLRRQKAHAQGRYLSKGEMKDMNVNDGLEGA